MKNFGKISGFIIGILIFIIGIVVVVGIVVSVGFDVFVIGL